MAAVLWDGPSGGSWGDPQNWLNPAMDDDPNTPQDERRTVPSTDERQFGSGWAGSPLVGSGVAWLVALGLGAGGVNVAVWVSVGGAGVSVLAGVSLGSGVVMVFNTDTDMAAIVQRIAHFFREESCGLCVPCRVGTVRQEEALVRLARDGDDHELELLAELDTVLKDASICGLGQFATVAVQSAIEIGLIGAER